MAHDIETEGESLPSSEIPADATGNRAVVGLTPTYLVSAHRWGEKNNHWYHVYAGLDRTKAVALARAEQADRGGKYACVVWEFDNDGTDERVIAYFHSSQCPQECMTPRHNHRTDFLQTLGGLLNDAAGGKCLQPTLADPNRLTYQPVSIPDCLKEAVACQRRLLRMKEEMQQKSPALNN